MARSTKDQHTVFVKNMVCPRCVLAVRQILSEQQISYENVIPGEIEMSAELSEQQLSSLREELQKVGFEIIASRSAKIIEDTKLRVREFLGSRSEQKENLSDFITEQIAYEYSYLSDLFSSAEGVSIEQFFISLRIEKVKELIVYDQLSLTEIAWETGFSSVHHLSAQFKKQTGLTPSHFRKISAAKRKAAGK